MAAMKDPLMPRGSEIPTTGTHQQQEHANSGKITHNGNIPTTGINERQGESLTAMWEMQDSTPLRSD
jgi:hypothetical protein